MKLPRYRTGDAELDADGRRAASSAGRRRPANADLVFELVASALRLGRDEADRGDLKIANAALKEMRYAFHVFAPYRAARKVAIFGSARTQPDDPLYEQAREFAAAIADRRLDGDHRRRSRDHGGRHRGRRARAARSA